MPPTNRAAKIWGACEEAVSPETQQRSVDRQRFVLPGAEASIEEIRIDDGKVRLHAPQGKQYRWQDYKP